VTKLFGAIDSDVNLQADKEELFKFCKGSLSMANRMIHDLDTDSDGNISILEWTEMFLKFKKEGLFQETCEFIQWQLNANAEEGNSFRMWGERSEDQRNSKVLSQ